MREPWFRIIDVTEERGLSIADIARQEAERHRVRLDDIRGPRTSHNLAVARRAVHLRIKHEQPDLTSAQVAIYMRKESSTVRHAWRREAA